MAQAKQDSTVVPVVKPFVDKGFRITEFLKCAKMNSLVYDIGSA